MFTKYYKHTLLTVVVLLTATSLSAIQVGTLITFDADTTAKASEVNANFIGLRTAVNDNDTRLTTTESDITAAEADITALGTSKQNRVTGTCADGEVISDINADGSVTCKDDIDTDTTQVGIEYSGRTDDEALPTDASPVTLISIAVTVTRPGYIHLTAKGRYGASHTEGDNDVGIRAGILDTNTTTEIDTSDCSYSYVYYTLASALAGGFNQENFFTQRTFNVTAAGTYTYYFRGRRNSATVNFQRIYEPSMTAIFIPNRY